MTEEIVLYSGDEDEGDRDITVEVDGVYADMLEQLKEEHGEMADANLARTVQSTIHQSLQARTVNGELHKAYAQLISGMLETGELDLSSVTENSIHEMKQQMDGGE